LLPIRLIQAGDNALNNSFESALSNILETISGTYKIIQHVDLSKDLSGILSGCGQVEKFLHLFANQCSQLSQIGKSMTQWNPKKFERLKHVDIEMYSMHIKLEKNIRILYTFNGDTIIMFLCAFDEKSGKKATDYTNYIPLAKKRLAECLEKENES